MHRMEKHFNNVDDYVTAFSWSGFQPPIVPNVTTKVGKISVNVSEF